MKRLAIAFLILNTLLCAAERKRKPKPRPAEIEVIDLNVHRASKLVVIEGHVKNIGERIAEEIVVEFEFLDADGQVMARKDGPVEEEVLEPGQEGRVRFETVDPVRAVRVALSACRSRSGGLRFQDKNIHYIQ